jgi:hypothetical protein
MSNARLLLILREVPNCQRLKHPGLACNICFWLAGLTEKHDSPTLSKLLYHLCRNQLKLESDLIMENAFFYHFMENCTNIFTARLQVGIFWIDTFQI